MIETCQLGITRIFSSPNRPDYFMFPKLRPQFESNCPDLLHESPPNPIEIARRQSGLHSHLSTASIHDARPVFDSFDRDKDV